MKGVYRGAPAKGGPAPGSWGDRYVIEKDQYHSDKMSCSKCLHYADGDKSCVVKPIHCPVDGWDYWKNCDKLKLSPEYDNEAMRDKIKQIRGQNFFQLSIKKDNTNYVKDNNTPVNNDKNRHKKIIGDWPQKYSSWSGMFDFFIRKINEKFNANLREIAITQATKMYVDDKKNLYISISKIAYRKTGTRYDKNRSLFAISHEILVFSKLKLNGTKMIVIPQVRATEFGCCERSLAEEYCAKYGFLLGEVKLVEIDTRGNVTEIKRS